MARFHHAVSDVKLSRILRVDLSSPLFTYEIDEKALALADIERGFRVLKSEIETAPVFHRLPDRIRAHALICFLALILYRVLQMRLKAKHNPDCPELFADLELPKPTPNAVQTTL
jgi:hypothetical protein